MCIDTLCWDRRCLNQENQRGEKDEVEAPGGEPRWVRHVAGRNINGAELAFWSRPNERMTSRRLQEFAEDQGWDDEQCC